MSEPEILDRTKSHPHPGLFLTLEGPDGGKSTQAERLAGWLRGEGLDVVICRDPGSTAVGNRLREIVMDRSTTHLGIRAEMLLYMASRAQLVDEVVQPALKGGRVVVSDRFLLSNIVYQGFAGGLDVEDLWQIGRIATGGLLPDLTLILDVPIDAARARVGPARDRIEDRPDGYQNRVREGFLDAARSGENVACPYYPAPVVLIDASLGPDAVFGQILDEVKRVLALNPRA